MGNEREDMVDLDLNLEPLIPLSPSFGLGSGALSSDLENGDDRIGERIRRIEAVTLRARHRYRWRQSRIPPETRNISMELVLNSGSDERLQIGEGSVAAAERTTGNCKTCKKSATDLIAKALGEEKEVEEEKNDNRGFFDCNVCLDMAREPVLTCCGHLFCWPCLYQWLHIHSDTKECPVCKGEVTDMGITPIYGRGNDNREQEEEDESGLKIPPRPQAQRVESFRQSIHRAATSFPIEEMVHRIGNRLDVTAEWVPTQDLGTSLEMPERTDLSGNRTPTSRGLRRERLGLGRHLVLGHNLGTPPEEIVDITEGRTANLEAEGSHRLPSLLRRRSQSQRTASLSSLSSIINSAERIIDAYYQNRPMRRNHSQSPPIEDRDSVSSIAAVMESGSQTVDTAMEIDSMVSLSSSSSRRRTDPPRVSDADSVVSRSTRRRRLN